jgi:uncharacterized membrane protein
VNAPDPGRGLRSAGRYLLVGVLTAAPLVITWLIVDFLFRQLSSVGRPIVNMVAGALNPGNPAAARAMANETVVSILATLAVLALLWLLGWTASRMIGQRLIGLMEWMIGRIPFVQTIYNATKRFLTVAGTQQGGAQRVVLIDFPSPEMKAVGLVTRLLHDKETGAELAAVYVPTSPNPTSGYIEIVPVEQLTWTDWTFDEAMAFIVTGGSNSPDKVNYTTRGRPPETPVMPPPAQRRRL